jgi:hypothetical protein
MKKIIIFTLIVSSCAYGPTQEKKSALNYLNGEHYDRSAVIFGVPVIERKTKETVISGRIQMDDPFAKIPGDVQLSLMSGEKIISTAHAGKSGIFKLQGVFSDGDYLLKAISTSLAGVVSLKINSYQMNDVLIVLR